MNCLLRGSFGRLTCSEGCHSRLESDVSRQYNGTEWYSLTIYVCDPAANNSCVLVTFINNSETAFSLDRGGSKHDRERLFNAANVS